MKTAFAALGAGLLVLGMARTAAAVPVTLDFEGFADGDVVSGPGVFSGVELSSDTTLLAFAMSPTPPDLSGARVAQGSDFSHAAPVRADFSSLTSFVSVAMGDFGGDEDALFLRAFDAGGSLLDEASFLLSAASDGGPTLSVSAANIAYVLFGSTGAFPNSVYFDNLTFEVAETTEVPVPEPATLTLMAGGLAALGLRRFRRRATS